MRFMTAKPFPATFHFAFSFATPLGYQFFQRVHGVRRATPLSVRPQRWSQVVRTTTSAVSPLIRGTSVGVRLDRVVDGDTVRIYPPGATKAEAVRILCVDTEESYAYSSKPVTPWGKAAKDFATDFFSGVESVTIEFPDDTPIPKALTKHRGNYGRLLVHVWRDDIDFAELLIRRGYSPYFTKYGHATFASHRGRYEAAERAAQADGLGVWDQLTVNGAVFLNYAALKTWWDVRAAAVDVFRRLRAIDKSLFDVREDYEALMELAGRGEVATVFADVRDVDIVPGRGARIDVGSSSKPFTVVVPRVDVGGEDDPGGAKVVALLQTRYAAESVDVPRRGYVFLSGRLRIARTRPQLVVDDPAAVGDVPGVRPVESSLPVDTDSPGVVDGGAVVNDDDDDDDPPVVPLPMLAVRIASVLPDPAGTDAGHEVVSLRATPRPITITAAAANAADATSSGVPVESPVVPPSISLDGWHIRDFSNRSMKLSGTLSAGEVRPFTIRRGSFSLNNTGDVVILIDAAGRVVHRVEYTAADVKTGTTIEFADSGEVM